jgi:hypothetical protein
MPERKLRRGPRRRSERFPAEIALQLTRTGEKGEKLTENSHTVTLSRHGASILSKRKLATEQQITIRRLDTGKEARARVAGMIADRVEGYVYSVEFVDPQTNLWDTEFPLVPDADEPNDRIFLVCGCCGKVEAVQFGDVKLGRFEMDHGVLLYCIQCQAMTRWMPQSDDAAAPQSA